MKKLLIFIFIIWQNCFAGELLDRFLDFIPYRSEVAEWINLPSLKSSQSSLSGDQEQLEKALSELDISKEELTELKSGDQDLSTLRQDLIDANMTLTKEMKKLDNFIKEFEEESKRHQYDPKVLENLIEFQTSIQKMQEQAKGFNQLND